MKTIALCSLILLFACHKPDPICKECGREVTYVKNFTDYYLKYLTYPDGPRLIQLDSITQIASEYRICYFDGINELEESKIIKARGGFTKACAGGSDVMQVDDFEIVNNCLGNIPIIDKSFNLTNVQWFVESVQVGSSIYQPPCEGLSVLYFSAGMNFEVSVSINSLSGQYSSEGFDRIKLSDEFIVSTSVGTRQQIIFENAFWQVFNRGALLKYTLNRNHLILINSQSNSTLKLFAK